MDFLVPTRIDRHSNLSRSNCLCFNERPRAHPMRTHPKRTQGECLRFFFPLPHEAAVWPSATVAKNMCFSIRMSSSLLKWLLLMVASVVKNPAMISHTPWATCGGGLGGGLPGGGGIANFADTHFLPFFLRSNHIFWPQSPGEFCGQ